MRSNLVKILTMVFAMFCALQPMMVWAEDDPSEMFDDAMEEVRSCLSAIAPAEAAAALDEAKENARTPEQQTDVQRLAEIVRMMGDYLDWISRISASSQITEIKLSPTVIVSVVEMTESEITVRAEGRNKTYRINEISPTLARILVKGVVNQSPDNKAIYGTFEAFHPKGDRAVARKFWEEAAKAGINTGSLIPELDNPRVPPAVVAPGAANRMPIPSDELLQQGQTFMKQKYGRQFDKAKSDPMKAKIVLLLLKSAGTDRRLAPEQRFAYLDEAQSIADQIGKPSLVCEALELKGKMYQINTFRKRMKIVSRMNVAETDKQGNRELATCAGKLLKEAGETKRFDDARLLIPIAKKAGTAGGVPQVVKLATQAEEFMGKSGL